MLKTLEGHAPLLSQCEKMAVEPVEGEQMLELQDPSDICSMFGFAPKARGCDGACWLYYGGTKARLCPKC